MGHNQSSHNGGDPEVTVLAKVESLEVVVRWEWGEKIAAVGMVAGRDMAVGRKRESAMV